MKGFDILVFLKCIFFNFMIEIQIMSPESIDLILMYDCIIPLYKVLHLDSHPDIDRLLRPSLGFDPLFKLEYASCSCKFTRVAYNGPLVAIQV